MINEAKIEDYAYMFMAASYAYYEHANSPMPDSQYDQLAKDLLESYAKLPQWFRDLLSEDDLRAGTAYHLRGKWPEWVLGTYKPKGAIAMELAPTRVTQPFESTKHRTPMLSLANGFEASDIEDFLNQVPMEERELTVEVKADGMAGNITYRKGALFIGATRGDGDMGEDITHILQHVVGVPMRLAGDDYPDWVEVRGEFVMRMDDFNAYNAQAEKDGDKVLANPRNGVAGTMRLKDEAERAKRRISFYAYGAIFDHDLEKQTQVMDKVVSWGFVRVPRLPETIQATGKLIDYLTSPEARQLISKPVPFVIDGAVLKFNSIAVQKRLGFRSRTPRWAQAYKFPAEVGSALIKEIILQVGRSGVVTPVAIIEPTHVCGVVVTRATLHNEEHIRAWDFRVGDRVLIRRAGDVVPEIFNNLDMVSKDRATDEPWKMPECCPSCGSLIQSAEGKKKVFCMGGLICPARLQAATAHLVSRDAFDIEGIAVGIIEQLIEKNYIRTPSDILKIDKPSWIIEFGDVLGPKIWDSVMKATAAIPLQKFIYALGIPQVGQSTSRDLANELGSMAGLMNATEERLLLIPGIEKVTANLILTFLHTGINLGEIWKLVDMTHVVNPEVRTERPLLGKTFVITGSFGDLSRSEMTDVLVSMGARVSSSVSKNTSVLMAGDEAGSKLAKATALGIDVLDKQQSISAINEMKQ